MPNGVRKLRAMLPDILEHAGNGQPMIARDQALPGQEQEDDRSCRAVHEPGRQRIVLCGDEKSQIQAFGRTQPGSPMKKGRADGFTQDFRRNGTTSLFAAFRPGRRRQPLRQQELIRFLRTIDKVPGRRSTTPDPRELRHAQA
jgi:hypothetical protein